MNEPVVDHTTARRTYRAVLEQTLEHIVRKSHKRTTRARVRAVSEYRGAEVEARDDDLLVRSDRHLGHANIIDYHERPFLDVEDQYAEISRAWERIDAGAVLVVATWRWVMRCATPPGTGCDAHRGERSTSSSGTTT